MTEVEAKELTAHPASELFPLMQDDDLKQLAEDIQTNGLRDPILLYEGKVLDGRNRLAACATVGVKPDFADAALNGASPTLFVISRNLHRRHLTLSQRATVGAEMLPMLRAEAKERQRHGGRNGGHLGGQGRPKNRLPAELPEAYSPQEVNDIGGESRSIAAKAVQAGGKTIQMAAAVMERDPQLFEQVKRGEVKVSTAYAKVMEVAPRKQRAATSQVEKTRRGEAAKRRMIDGLSHIRGLCRGLSELNVALLLPALTDKDRSTWAGISLEASRQLRQFAHNLKAKS